MIQQNNSAMSTNEKAIEALDYTAKVLNMHTSISTRRPIEQEYEIALKMCDEALFALRGKQEHADTAWISVEEKMPLDGQFCWVCYYPWNNKSNALAVQEASWKNGLWITTQPEGTSYPPTHWMLHPGPVPPAPPQTPVEP